MKIVAAQGKGSVNSGGGATGRVIGRAAEATATMEGRRPEST